MLDREELAGAPEARLDLVDDHNDPVLVAEAADAVEERLRRDDEAALPLDGLDHDRRDGLGGDLRDQRALEGRERLVGARPAVIVRERHPVDLGRERPQPRLVRMRLRGERKRKQRAAVETALEPDHRRAAGVGARELDRVLDRFRAGVEERRLGRRAERRGPDQPLRECDVDLVGDDREVGVGELGELLLRGLDDARMRVADVEAADAAGEVDEGIAVDVRERCAAAFLDHDGEKDGQRVGDHALLAGQNLAGSWPRNRRLQLDRSRHRHASEDT